MGLWLAASPWETVMLLHPLSAAPVHTSCSKSRPAGLLPLPRPAPPHPLLLSHPPQLAAARRAWRLASGATEIAMPEAVVSVEGEHEEEPRVTIDEEDQYASPARQVRGQGWCGCCTAGFWASAVGQGAFKRACLRLPIPKPPPPFAPPPPPPHTPLQLVAEMMILAGEAVGELGRRLSVPLPYRGQAEPVLPDAEELAAGGCMREAGVFMQRRWRMQCACSVHLAACLLEERTCLSPTSSYVGCSQSCLLPRLSAPLTSHRSFPQPCHAAVPPGPCQAVLLRMRMTRSVMATAVPLRHAGLGLEAYVQFTSPIRR